MHSAAHQANATPLAVKRRADICPTWRQLDAPVNQIAVWRRRLHGASGATTALKAAAQA